MNDQTLLFGCIFGAVALVAFFASRMLVGKDDGKIRGRLTATSYSEAPSRTKRSVRELIHQLGQVAAQPFMPKTREKQSGLRRSLGLAGIYAPVAIRAVTGAKVICLAAGIISGYVVGTMMDQLLFGLSIGGLVGYLAPTLWLRLKVRSNQKALTHGLADVLDLMVVCVEAGLTVDAAMQRVGQEMALAHPALSREMGMTHMETRVGLSRSEALRNLGQRTGNAALQSLAAMLIQADRFGTSIASSLRIHSETLRIARQNAAEESAAKASVKISFPLVLFIFPATFIVLAGPTIINLMNSELMK